METVNVTIEYRSEEPPGFGSVKYRMTKVFTFPKLPPMMGCFILLHNDAISGFTFKDAVYDPACDTYYVTNKSSEGVERYYHGDAEKVMMPVIARFKNHGWMTEKVEKRE